MDPSFSQSCKQLEAVAGQKAGLQTVQGGGCSTLFGTMTQTGLAEPGPDHSPSAFGISPTMEWQGEYQLIG